MMQQALFSDFWRKQASQLTASGSLKLINVINDSVVRVAILHAVGSPRSHTANEYICTGELGGEIRIYTALRYQRVP